MLTVGADLWVLLKAGSGLLACASSKRVTASRFACMRFPPSLLQSHARQSPPLCCTLMPQYNANLEARMKYADQPDRFMESEADLDEAVKALLVVASAPDLYPELVAR